MRTLLVVHPSAELYGADRMLLEATRGFVEAGWRCVVVLPVDGPLVPLLAGLGVEVRLADVPVLRKAAMTPRGLPAFAAAQLRALPAARRLLAEVDPAAVYVSTLTVPQWLGLARAAGRPALCHVHEAEEGVPAVVRAGLAAPLLLARAVVANSAASRSVLVRQLPALGRRTTVVYNGVPGPPDAVPPPRARLEGRTRLVLVGRLSERKGTDVAVAAVAQLVAEGRDVALDLVGDVFPGYEWFRDGLHRSVAEAGLGDRVAFLGEQPDPWAALAAADVALVPSRVEPFGNTAVEAMLAGRPVVAGRTQGLREIVSAGRNGELADPGDPTSLAAAVRRVLDDWPAALTRAELARREAVARFAPERYRRDVAAAVEALVRTR